MKQVQILEQITDQIKTNEKPRLVTKPIVLTNEITEVKARQVIRFRGD